MPFSTNTEALREMRRLELTSTGRLTAGPARYASRTLATLELRDTPEPWHCRILTDLTERAGGSLRPDSAEYLVFSDNLLIAVLTAAAQVELPDYPLSPVQRRHQSAAAQALADLPRNTLRELADRRASMDGRDDQTRLESNPPADAIRVAALDDPTVTDWVTLDTDLETSRTSIRRCGLDPDRLIVITAPGYGRYGRDRHRLDLPILSAMRQLAAQHQVSTAVVGDWLDAEGATNAHPGPSPEQIRTAFTAAYIGALASELDYTRHHMTELGWIATLEHAGIPDRYLDAAAVNRDWFRSRFRGISRTPHHASTYSAAPPPPGSAPSLPARPGRRHAARRDGVTQRVVDAATRAGRSRRCAPSLIAAPRRGAGDDGAATPADLSRSGSGGTTASA